MIEIFVTNPTVLTWVDQCNKLNKNQETVSRRISNFDMAEYACAESTLRDYLSGRKPYEKLRSLDFFGESPAGKFFNNHMLDYLGNPRWYTSGYDPNGFLGWHEDTCEAGYFIMFSYSESGQGIFKYLDNQTNAVVELIDRPGWMVRSGFTGNNETDAWWHCVNSNCPRWTWIYIWDTEEQQKFAISKLIG